MVKQSWIGRKFDDSHEFQGGILLLLESIEILIFNADFMMGYINVLIGGKRTVCVSHGCP